MLSYQGRGGGDVVAVVALLLIPALAHTLVPALSHLPSLCLPSLVGHSALTHPCSTPAHPHSTLTHPHSTPVQPSLTLVNRQLAHSCLLLLVGTLFHATCY